MLVSLSIWCFNSLIYWWPNYTNTYQHLKMKRIKFHRYWYAPMHSIMRAAFSRMNRMIRKIAHIADFQELKNKWNINYCYKKFETKWLRFSFEWFGKQLICSHWNPVLIDKKYQQKPTSERDSWVINWRSDPTENESDDSSQHSF